MEALTVPGLEILTISGETEQDCGAKFPLSGKGFLFTFRSDSPDYSTFFLKSILYNTYKMTPFLRRWITSTIEQETEIGKKFQ